MLALLRLGFRAVVFLMLAFSSAWASQEGIIESTQPILTENVIRPATVTYVQSGMVHVVGASVAWTCRENHIQTDSEPENRNAANLAGFQVELVQSDSTWHPLFGDTIRVTLAVQSIGEKDAIDLLGSRFSTKGLVDATVESLRENAGRGVPPARFLDLRIVGSKRYSKLSRVYRVIRSPEHHTYY